MPRPTYDTLSPRAQQLCRLIVADEGEALDLGWRPLLPFGGATALSAERMQDLRNEPVRGSHTGYWPPTAPKL